VGGNERVGRLGKASFTQSGGVNTIAATLAIGTHGTYTLTGGTLAAQTTDNAGHFDITGSTPGVALSETVGGAITNAASGTVKITNANVTWTGTFANEGAYQSDPSAQTFSTLAVSATGYLQGGAGDTFQVAQNLINDSTENALWQTSLSTLDFLGSAGTSHDFAVAGQNGAGFDNNFSWGTLQLNFGNSLDVTDGSGNALYVNYLDLQGGVSQLTDLSGSNAVFYYNQDNVLNGYLGGRSYTLGHGFSLDPFIGPAGGLSSVPEPATWGLFGAGLIGLALQRRRRRPAGNGPAAVCERHGTA
jgi:hypothetical protein